MTPYPFTEEKDWREGHRSFTFSAFDRPWGLLTIDGEEDKHSLLWPKDENRTGVWPRYRIMTLAGVVDVQAAVEVVRAVYGAYCQGEKAGADQARAQVREALGIER